MACRITWSLRLRQAITGARCGSGHLGGGLNRFLGGKFTHLNTRNGFFEDAIFTVLPDQRGDFWLTSNKGVFRVHEKDLNAVSWMGAADHVEYRSFGIADGMRTRECNGAFQNSSWRTHEGILLFPTMKGVAMVDPANLREAILCHRQYRSRRSWQTADAMNPLGEIRLAARKRQTRVLDSPL